MKFITKTGSESVGGLVEMEPNQIALLKMWINSRFQQNRKLLALTDDEIIAFIKQDEPTHSMMEMVYGLSVREWEDPIIAESIRSHFLYEQEELEKFNEVFNQVYIESVYENA